MVHFWTTVQYQTLKLLCSSCWPDAGQSLRDMGTRMAIAVLWVSLAFIAPAAADTRDTATIWKEADEAQFCADGYRVSCGSSSQQVCQQRGCCYKPSQGQPSCFHRTQPQPTQADVIVHLFEWSWKDVALECEHVLGPMGYSAVQVSPATEDIGDYDARPFPNWSTRYKPTSYRLQSRSGDEAAFADMTRRCKAVGVDIIVDVVLNHMADGADAGKGRISPFFSKDRNFPAVPYDCSHFHHGFGTPPGSCKNCNISDDDYNNNVARVQTCDLLGLPDLDTGNPYVQQKQADLLNRLSQLGAAGVRLDATKHIALEDLAAVFDLVDQPLYANMETIQTGHNVPPVRQYDNIGSPWEFKVPIAYADAFVNKQDLSYIANIDSGSQYAGDQWAFGNRAISFVINHDLLLDGSKRPFYVTVYNEGSYSLALQLLLAHPYGQPNVLSSPGFTPDPSVDNRLDSGYSWFGIPALTPSDTRLARVYNGANQSIGCGYWRDTTSTGTGFPKPYVCEHRWPEVAAMVKWRRQMFPSFTTYSAQFQAGNKVMSVSYPGNGFFIFSIDSSTFTYNGYQTSLPAGSYCNVLVPGCTSRITVYQGGTTNISLGPKSSFAISKFSMAEVPGFLK